MAEKSLRKQGIPCKSYMKDSSIQLDSWSFVILPFAKIEKSKNLEEVVQFLCV